MNPDGSRASSPLRRFFILTLASLLTRDKVTLVAFLLFSIICVAALFAPFIAVQNPYDLASLNLLDSRLAPGEQGVNGTIYLLGTDNQGRDMMSAILYGLRISLLVGVTSIVVSAIVGTLLGLFAGYRGGWFDTVVMRIVDLQLSIPAIFVGLVLLAVLGRGIDKIILALILVQWVYFARTVRGSVLVEKKKEYVAACQVLRLSRFRILFTHILPNIVGPLSVVATVEFATAIALEATLSFLGVGLPITEPSLGLLIANGFAYLLNGEYWVSIYPGLALLLTVFSLNLFGDQLRETFNPRGS